MVDGTARQIFHAVPTARKIILKRCVVSLVDDSLGVDAVVTDWSVVDHLSRKDASKAAFLSLSLSLALLVSVHMSLSNRSRFFDSGLKLFYSSA